MNPARPAPVTDDPDDRDGKIIDLPALREPERLDLIGLSEVEPAPPRWVLAGWLPAGYTTLLSSHGAGGKSQIAAHIAASLAADLPWAGIAAAGRYRVLLVSCEDGRDVLHWRLSRYAAAGSDTWRLVHTWAREARASRPRAFFAVPDDFEIDGIAVDFLRDLDLIVFDTGGLTVARADALATAAILAGSPRVLIIFGQRTATPRIIRYRPRAAGRVAA